MSQNFDKAFKSRLAPKYVLLHALKIILFLRLELYSKAEPSE